MNRAANFTIGLLALAGAAFSQDVNRISAGDGSFPRGSLLRDNSPGGVSAATQKQLSEQLRVKNQINFYEVGQSNYERSYKGCLIQESKKPKESANPLNCENHKNIADYYAGMAAAARKNQTQFGTTHSSEALGVPVPAPAPSQVGQRLPKMPSYLNGGR